MLGTVSIKGGKELDAALRALDAKLGRKVVSAALREGAKPAQRAVQALAPVLQTPKKGRTPGALRQDIKVRAAKRRRRDGSVAILVGPQAKWFQGDTFYGGFQEFGWKTGKRGSSNRRQIPGEHFVEFGFEETVAQSIQAIVDETRQRLADLVNEVKSRT